MKTRYIVLITVLATLAIEAILFSSWLSRDLLLSWIDPGPAHSNRIIVTNDVVLLNHDERVIGHLAPGEAIYLPCRHDLWTTEPFDPRTYKIYVELTSEAWQTCLARPEDLPSNFVWTSIGRVAPMNREKGSANQQVHGTQ